MEKRPKRSNTVEKDYRERKRQRRRSSGEKSLTQTITTPPAVVRREKSAQSEPFEQLYNDIIDYKDPDDDDYDLCTIFMELPSEEDYPDYYEVIKHPIALENIKQKIDNKDYNKLSQLKADIDLMASNAKKYNLKDSQVYNDAVKIQKFVKQWQAPKPKAKAVLKLPGKAFAEGSSPPKIKAIKLRAVDKNKSKNIKALMQAITKKETKRSLELLEEDQDLDPNELVAVEMFNDKFTWSPLHAASYYGDVKLVEALIQRGANVELNDTWYSATPLGWAAFGDKDKIVRLLVQKHHANTKAENIHGQTPIDVVSNQDDPRWIGLLKDAPTTRKPSIQQKQVEPKQQQILFQQPTKTQIQVKTVPFQAYQPVKNVDGTIKKRRGRPPKSETDLAAVRPTAEMDINTFDPVAFEIELFNAIRTHTDNTNRLYSEQFEDLPDRDEYPEYYKTIKNPRSLTDIAEKMQTRQYPNLHAWWSDMSLVFQNALSFNEPGSRIFRDAKLLTRLLHRLKERILARLLVPVSQEDAVFRLNLMNRPFDVDALSEDKRKLKRFLSHNKSRTHSMEPDQQLQQQLQQQQQALLLQQQQQQAMLLQQQQQVLLQQQQQQLLRQPMPLMMPQYDYAAANAATHVVNTAASHVANTTANSTAISTTDTTTPRSPLPKASKEFYALCQEEAMLFLNHLKISSVDNDLVDITIDGDFPNHSVNVPASVETLKLEPQLTKVLKQEEKRTNITVLQNNIKLNTEAAEWQTIPLTRGTNIIKINITANCTRPESAMPEYKTKLYHLFVTRNW